jgi:hypothetical protein
MKVIAITRRGSQVTFEPVSIDITENVVFSNQDPQEAHWPTLRTCDNQLGAAPSPNSSECPVPPPSSTAVPPYTVPYGCRYHPQEQGTINVYAALAPDTTVLAAGRVNQPIAVQRVVLGGQPPYTISGQLYQITASNQVIQKGSGIGPGLQLNQGSNGITVSGSPTVAGTYTFTFTVDDSMGRNLQQTQYTMVVSA